MRVLVVDDSVVVRRLVTMVLDEAPDIEVVGSAANGRIALDKIPVLAPDLVTMDVEMPVMDGIEAVRQMRRLGSRLPVVMFSTLTERGAEATLDALAAGASDYVTKPTNIGSIRESMASVREQLVPRVRALAGRSQPAPPRRDVGPLRRSSPDPVPPPRRSVAGPSSIGLAPMSLAPMGLTPMSLAPVGLAPVVAPTAAAAARTSTATPAVVAIGSSTGGPEALATVMRALPADLAVPVLVTQHMPPTFTRQLAARLDRSSPLRVCEVEQGQPLAPGVVHVAPGDWHLRLRRTGTSVLCRLDQGPPENYCRPAVDVMLRSAVEVFGAGVLAVVLTGMGTDGRAGCADVRRAGGQVLAQDEPTSVVWGMPGAVVGAGLADAVVPLGDVAGAVVRAVRSTPRGRPADALVPTAER